MVSADGRWCLSYNGEVYNFEDLRQELLRSGHTFRSRTDTEVVLHAFMEWGEKCLDRFVGMFAFAVYDRHTDTVTLVRDRLGIKPLYYMRLAGHVLFSSEMKALVQASGHPRVNRQRLIEWSLYRNVDVLSPETLVENIYSILPGHLVTITSQAISSQCYYSPSRFVDAEAYAQFNRAQPDTVIAEVEDIIQQSIKDRLVSDVPVGTLCSGGIDSSLITAVAARYRKEITAFHVSVAGYPALDEKRYVEEVTNNVGAQLICYPLDGKAFRRELPRAIYHSDLPLTHPNSVAFFLICQVARANGVIVLLSGEGADELFGGYAWRYRRYRHLVRARRLLRLLPRKVRKGIELAGYACNGMPATGFLFDQLLPHTVAFLDNYAREDWTIRNQSTYGFVENRLDRAVLGVMLADLADFLTPLLRRLDRMSMGASVECRVPFLDHRIVNRVINLPLAYRVSRRVDKWVLKQIASHYLPPGIVSRKKAGFPLPLHDYLAPLARTDLFDTGFCSEILGLSPMAIQRTLTDWNQNIEAFFNLVSLEIWGRLFILGESLEQVNDLLLRIEHTRLRSRVL
jgi:asparagine synthase (glutamine-hydrolysing)